jgi:hypothetical protein
MVGIGQDPGLAGSVPLPHLPAPRSLAFVRPSVATIFVFLCSFQHLYEHGFFDHKFDLGVLGRLVRISVLHDYASIFAVARLGGVRFRPLLAAA